MTDVSTTTRLVWSEQATDDVLKAETVCIGFVYLILSTSDGRVSWNSPFEEGGWKFVKDVGEAKAAAQDEYTAFLKAHQTDLSPFQSSEG